MKQMELMRGMELFNQAASGDRVSTGRLLSMVENPANETLQLLQEKIRVSHNCCVIGITGAPGAGKSSLIGSLLEFWKNEGQKVAVWRLTPAAPFQVALSWGIGFVCWVTAKTRILSSAASERVATWVDLRPVLPRLSRS